MKKTENAEAFEVQLLTKYTNRMHLLTATWREKKTLKYLYYKWFANT